MSARRKTPGRGTLAHQAIARLLRYPKIANQVTMRERADLEGCREAGVSLLRELLDSLCVDEEQILAEVITDENAAAGEVRSALRKLADGRLCRRLEYLERKSRRGRLTGNEIAEFQYLIEELGKRRRST